MTEQKTMQQFSTEDFKPEYQANQYHIGLGKRKDGEKVMIIFMTDNARQIIAHGNWPLEDWEKIKKDIDHQIATLLKPHLN